MPGVCRDARYPSVTLTPGRPCTPVSSGFAPTRTVVSSTRLHMYCDPIRRRSDLPCAFSPSNSFGFLVVWSTGNWHVESTVMESRCGGGVAISFVASLSHSASAPLSRVALPDRPRTFTNSYTWLFVHEYPQYTWRDRVPRYTVHRTVGRQQEQEGKGRCSRAERNRCLSNYLHRAVPLRLAITA
ncbi:hypothetical protein VTK26DRAFT_713 [Humicola hyalothermophila]